MNDKRDPVNTGRWDKVTLLLNVDLTVTSHRAVLSRHQGMTSHLPVLSLTSTAFKLWPRPLRRLSLEALEGCGQPWRAPSSTPPVEDAYQFPNAKPQVRAMAHTGRSANIILFVGLCWMAATAAQLAFGDCIVACLLLS